MSLKATFPKEKRAEFHNLIRTNYSNTFSQTDNNEIKVYFLKNTQVKMRNKKADQMPKYVNITLVDA